MQQAMREGSVMRVSTGALHLRRTGHPRYVSAIAEDAYPRVAALEAYIVSLKYGYE